MTTLYQDTIVAPATTPGTGAISIVRISGPDSFRIVDAVVKLKRGTVSESKAYTIHFGEVFDAAGSLLDQVLVSVFRAPHSYTGEDSVEISAHASSFIVSELVRLLVQSGARLAEPGEYTRRAYLNGKMDLAQAEAVADVISSTTSASHRVAMNQLKGGFSAHLSDLRAQLLEMASLLELELDFSEEDVEFAEREQLERILADTLVHVESLAASFRQGNLIKNGVPVAIAGPVNAGKSTLLNALVGEDRALVSDQAGTTRDTIEETLQIDGILFRFIDTAGLRENEASDLVERMGIDRTYRKISQAEVVLAVLDSSAPEALIQEQFQGIVGRIDWKSQLMIAVLNKADKVTIDGINKNVKLINNIVKSFGDKCVVISISAKQQSGINELKNALKLFAIDLIPNADSTFITNQRHYQSLLSAAQSLRQVRMALSSGIPTDLVAEDLRRAIASINEILGAGLLDPDTVLHAIFSRHCIGK